MSNSRFSHLSFLLLSELFKTLFQIRTTAREEGMTSLRESGLLALYDGMTTVEEVLRETMLSI